uniref:Uncharacterized protein n=1 Tax=Cacopsylla melanoneura TaxID=428564 RepID=A0A8D8WQA2_9HEMI
MTSLVDQIGLLLDQKLDKTYDVLVSKIISVTSELEIVKKKNAFLEKDSKRRNFILYGVQENYGETFTQLKTIVLHVLNDLMKSDVTFFEIDQCLRLGKKHQSRPILVKCLTQWRKQEIMSRMNHLKGKGIYVEHDLTKEQIQRRREVIVKMKEMREQGCYAVVKIDKLVVNGAVQNNATDSVNKKLVTLNPDANMKVEMKCSKTELSDEQSEEKSDENSANNRIHKKNKIRTKKKHKPKKKTHK